MHEMKDYDKLRVDLLDFTQSVKEFASVIDILDGYYQFYCSEYKEFWRFGKIITMLNNEKNNIINKIEELKQNIV